MNFYNDVDDWLGGFYASPGMQGTRPALPMATAWAILHHLGAEGYRRLTQLTLATRRRLVEGVRAIPALQVLGEPEAHLVAITAAPGDDPIDVFALGDALQARGWFHDRQKPPDSLHATVSAGNAPVIEEYLRDLAACVAEVGGGRTDFLGSASSVTGEVHNPGIALCDKVVAGEVGPHARRTKPCDRDKDKIRIQSA